MQADGRDACEGLSRAIGAGLEGPGDPEAGAPLHLLEGVEWPFHGCSFVEPEPTPIGSYGQDTGTVKLPLVLGAHAP